MAEGLTGSSLRSAPRALGTQSGRMYREARKLERKGFGGAAERVAMAAAQQKLGERPGFSSADTEIERQKLQQQADRQTAAVQSGMAPADSRQQLFRDMQSGSRSGLTGAEGAKQLAGYRARATQLGVAPDRFESTATGKLGIDLRALSQTPAAGPVASTGTTAAGTGTGAVAAPSATGPMVDNPKPMDAEFLRSVRRLTSAEGGDLTRKAAVEELNRQRMAEGKTEVNPNDVFNTLLAQDRAQSDQRASDLGAARQITGGLLSTAPRGATDPDLLASFRKPQPAPVAATPTTPPAAAPAQMSSSQMLGGIFRGVVDEALAPVTLPAKAALTAAQTGASRVADAARFTSGLLRSEASAAAKRARRSSAKAGEFVSGFTR